MRIKFQDVHYDSSGYANLINIIQLMKNLNNAFCYSIASVIGKLHIFPAFTKLFNKNVIRDGKTFILKFRVK